MQILPHTFNLAIALTLFTLSPTSSLHYRNAPRTFTLPLTLTHTLPLLSYPHTLLHFHNILTLSLLSYPHLPHSPSPHFITDSVLTFSLSPFPSLLTQSLTSALHTSPHPFLHTLPSPSLTPHKIPHLPTLLENRSSHFHTFPNTLPFTLPLTPYPHSSPSLTPHKNPPPPPYITYSALAPFQLQCACKTPPSIDQTQAFRCEETQREDPNTLALSKPPIYTGVSAYQPRLGAGRVFVPCITGSLSRLGASLSRVEALLSRVRALLVLFWVRE